MSSAVNELLTTNATIDLMTTSGLYGNTYSPGGNFYVLGFPDEYFLSDGTSWMSGAGSFSMGGGALDHVEVSGTTVRYILNPPLNGVLSQYTDYDSGNHSSQGVLGVAGPLVIEATIGSSTAVMTGELEIVSNDITWYGEPRFNFYSTIVGSTVPFEVTYTNQSGPWTATTFDANFSYRMSGSVDFSSPTSVPLVVDLEIGGSAQVPSGSSVQYKATAVYDNGARFDVTDSAAWSVEPAAIATISDGLLVTGAISTPREQLTIMADYEENGESVHAQKVITAVLGGSTDLPSAWETYQGDRSHTGYAPIPLQPDVFTFKWQRMISPGRQLNPVTAADGRVFVSLYSRFNNGTHLFVLDDRDGETLWSTGFGDPYSVNPPSYAYGNVYIQTCNHSSDTYLHAFDAATGQRVFQAAHSAQWERYYAPTVHEGTVYVNGGSYGGMYAFNAFSGEQEWFTSLPQYDEWTPAVDDDHAYAYMNDGLFILDRRSGALEYKITDPGYQWNGYAMRLAPVLGQMGDVLVIQAGRLISFDLPGRSIRWQAASSFIGQPSVHAGVVYAIDAGRLRAMDQMTGAALWSWQPPGGSLAGELVVTDTHVFASTASNTYAVELLSGTAEWSFPAGGHLALSDETLYIAGSEGTLTAISMPEYVPADVVSVEITGPPTVVENSTAQYTAMVTYADGRARDRSANAAWSVTPSTDAQIDGFGEMTVSQLLAPSVMVTVRASYTERGITVEAEMGVQLVIGVTIQEFLDRNIAGAVSINQQIWSLMQQARAMEEAAQAVLLDMRDGRGPLSGHPPWETATLNNLVQALTWQQLSETSLENSTDDLMRAIHALRTLERRVPYDEDEVRLPTPRQRVPGQ